MYRASKYDHHLLIADIVILFKRRKVAKPARGQLYPRGKYIHICTGTVLLFVLVYIPGTGMFFIWGHVQRPVAPVAQRYLVTL